MVGRAIKLMVRLALFSFAVVAVIVWLLFFSDRPENQIDPFTLAGDGSALNYCELPPLMAAANWLWIFRREIRPGAPTSTFRYPFCANARNRSLMTQTTLEACGLVSRADTQGTLSALSNVVNGLW